MRYNVAQILNKRILIHISPAYFLCQHSMLCQGKRQLKLQKENDAADSNFLAPTSDTAWNSCLIARGSGKQCAAAGKVRQPVMT